MQIRYYGSGCDLHIHLLPDYIAHLTAYRVDLLNSMWRWRTYNITAKKAKAININTWKDQGLKDVSKWTSRAYEVQQAK